MKVMSLLIQGCSLREGPHHYEITADHYFQLEGGQTEMVELTRQAGLIPNELHDLRNNRLKSWIEVASVKGV